jgi:hypothetical protein
MHSMMTLLETSYRMLDSILDRNPRLSLFVISGGLFLGSVLLDRHARLSLNPPKASISNQSVGDGTA